MELTRAASAESPEKKINPEVDNSASLNFFPHFCLSPLVTAKGQVPQGQTESESVVQCNLQRTEEGGERGREGGRRREGGKARLA